MAIYILTILYVGCFSFLSRKVGKGNVWTDVFLFLPIFLIAGLRGVGADTPVYTDMYSYMPALPDLQGISAVVEPGFLLTIAIHKWLFNDVLSYFIFYSFFQTLLLCLVYRKLGRSTLFLVVYLLVFYLNFHLNTIRAGVAVLLLILAFESEKVKTSVVLFFVAVLFHLSSVIFLPLLCMFKFRRFSWRGGVFFLIIAMLLPVLIYMFGARFADKLFSYNGYLGFRQDGISITGTLYIVLALASLFFLRVVQYKYLLVSVALVVVLLLKYWSMMFYRVELMLFVFYIYYAIKDVIVRNPRAPAAICIYLIISMQVFFAVSGVLSESRQIQLRLNAGDAIGKHALDSVYVPYKVFWENEYLRR